MEATARTASAPPRLSVSSHETGPPALLLAERECVGASPARRPLPCGHLRPARARRPPRDPAAAALDRCVGAHPHAPLRHLRSDLRRSWRKKPLLLGAHLLSVRARARDRGRCRKVGRPWTRCPGERVTIEPVLGCAVREVRDLPPMPPRETDGDCGDQSRASPRPGHPDRVFCRRQRAAASAPSSSRDASQVRLRARPPCRRRPPF